MVKRTGAALNIKRAHFVDNSMGGRIAAKLAYHYPELTLSSTVSNSIIKTDRPLIGFCFTGGVGHLPYIEQPEKFSEVILRFIGGVK